MDGFSLISQLHWDKYYSHPTVGRLAQPHNKVMLFTGSLKTVTRNAGASLDKGPKYGIRFVNPAMTPNKKHNPRQLPYILKCEGTSE